jgi:hypothetical protein
MQLSDPKLVDGVAFTLAFQVTFTVVNKRSSANAQRHRCFLKENRRVEWVLNHLQRGTKVDITVGDVPMYMIGSERDSPLTVVKITAHRVTVTELTAICHMPYGAGNFKSVSWYLNAPAPPYPKLRAFLLKCSL